jgi:hypothetical protein
MTPVTFKLNELLPIVDLASITVLDFYSIIPGISGKDNAPLPYNGSLVHRLLQCKIKNL